AVSDAAQLQWIITRLLMRARSRSWGVMRYDHPDTAGAVPLMNPIRKHGCGTRGLMKESPMEG
ncbi:hypothetical protein HAX54_049796, partial [Datura stramonium]|nr:hypothetical protein [Datura stramonium]